MTAEGKLSSGAGFIAPEVLEGLLGHTFRDPSVLVRALTHKSRASESTAAGESCGDNEQLEFLGDSVLGFLVSDWLVSRYPSLPEGGLSKLKAHLVSSAHLYAVAQRLDLGRHLRLGRGEEMSGGRAKKGLLANALEAIIAAVYVDGGLAAAQSLVLAHVIGAFDESECTGKAAPLDFKSALQELAQTLRLPTPRYHVVREQGPEHDKVFTVEVRVGKEMTRQGEGASKKSAGQRAAQQAFEELTTPRPGAD